MHEEAARRLSGVTPRQAATGEVCAICRHRCPPKGRSVCDVCVPPEESEIKERAARRRMEGEVRELHAACEDHVRIRNEMTDRIEQLEQALRYAAGCATLEMVRDTARGMGVIQ